MEFYEILEDIMSEKDMSIPDVSRATGISDSTLRSIINRKTKSASLEVAFKISKGLNVSLERLNGDAKVESKKLNFFLESFEIDHIKKYRDLDEYGRKTIDLILERELDRYKQFKQLQHKSVSLSSVETFNEPTEDYDKKVIPFAGTANDALPIPKDEETAPQRKEDPYTVIAAHNDNEDPDQYELMMEDAADLLDDDD